MFFSEIETRLWLWPNPRLLHFSFHAAGLRGTHAGLRGTHIYVASAHDQNKECRFPREKLGQAVS